MSIRTIPDRDAVPPPQLPADAPILDILEPVEIDLLETFRHNFDTSIAYCVECRAGKRVHLHEPLRGYHRLDDFTSALCTRDGSAIWLGLDHQTRLLHVLPEIFARDESILTLVWAAIFVDLRGFIQHRDDRQVMTLRDGIVIGVVARSDLERAGAEIHADIFIRDDRDLTPKDWHNSFHANELFIAFIIRVNCHSGITQNCFGSNCRDGDVSGRVWRPAASG